MNPRKNPSFYDDDERWRKLDWTRRSADIAREQGFSLEYVRKKRKMLGIPVSRNPPPPRPERSEIPETILETCRRFGVNQKLAREWHDWAGIERKPVGPPTKNPPPDWYPQKTFTLTAAKYGVSASTARRWHRMAGAEAGAGIPRGLSIHDKPEELSRLHGVSKSTACRWLRVLREGAAMEGKKPGP